jgi:hypothetical protein
MRAMTATASRSRLGLGELLVCLALAALHLALSAPLRSPIVFGDEAAHLGIARFLAGRPPYPLLASPAMGWTPYYHFGYPLLLAPLARLGGPLTLYHGALALNALALAGLYLILAFFAQRVLGLPRLDAGLAALAASLYPAFLIQGNIAWSESVLITVVALLPVAFYRLGERADRRGGALGAALFCALAAFSYAVHLRALALVPLAFLAVLVLWRTGRLPGRAVLAAALTTGAALLAIRAVDAVIVTRLWAGSRQRVTALDLAARLADPVSLGHSLLALAGQLWYLTVASAGLFPLGVWVLVRTVRQGDTPARRLTAGFTLAVAAVILGTSALFFGEFTRGDTAIYGRYNEAFLAPFLVAGLAGFSGLVRQRFGRRLAAAALPVALTALLAAVVIGFQAKGVLALVYNVMNVVGIGSLTLAMGGIHLLRLSAIGIAAALAVHAAGLLRPRAAAVLAGLLFLAGGLSVQRWMVGTNQAGDAARSIPRAVRGLGVQEVAYDLSGFAADEYFAYQFRLGDVRMNVFDIRRGPPPDALVISNKSFGRARPGTRLVFPDRYVDQALWVMPGALQDRLAHEGRLFPTDPAAPLPAAACRSHLAWAGAAPPAVMHSGEVRTLRLRVAHRGSDAPWLPAGALKTDGGAVRIATVWTHEGVKAAEPRTELNWAVVPGDEIVVDLPFAAAAADGKPLPPGRYEVRIGLVQELVLWFADVGDGTLVQKVEIR